MSIPFRLPAEWEPQSAILLAWPHAQTDWAARLAEVQTTYWALVQAISRFQSVLICVPDQTLQRALEKQLISRQLTQRPIRLIVAPYQDTWIRDYGPITLTNDQGAFRLYDFRFNGWGNKFAATVDDQLTAALVAQGLFQQTHRQPVDFVLEGGAIDSDGAGTVMTTWRCLQARHANQSRAQLQTRLQQLFASQRVIGLEHGSLQGDDTDAHIDTLARFAGPDAIVYQACSQRDDPHYQPLQTMASELATLSTLTAQPYRLFPLPWPRPIYDDRNRRLPASYANFLMINHAVLMPSYDDPADTQALAILAQAFPNREIVPVPSRPLIWQNGSLHCITMQLPAGMLAN